MEEESSARTTATRSGAVTLFSTTSWTLWDDRMPELSFDLVGWLASDCGDDEDRATMGSLRITAGKNLSIPITEVEDTLAQTVRSHVNVPLGALAEWLLVNWWRLRWEGKRARITTEWRRAHSLSAIGGGYAWPALEVSSDGEFIQLYMAPETAADVSGVRYLRPVSLELPSAGFESAVERLVDVVEARLATRLPGYRDLAELRAEVTEERSRPGLADACRWQALAGIDPGNATDTWIKSARTLVGEVGEAAGNEVLSAVSDLPDGLKAARETIEAMKRSSTSVDLSFVGPPSTPPRGELPWQTGARLATQLRSAQALGEGPLSNQILSDLLKTPIPLQGQPLGVDLSGGFRNSVAGGRTKIVWKGRRPEGQRFYLARLIGAARVLAADEHLVPVTNSSSALQKLERSFAQELLCPWEALDAYTKENGVGDDALEDAAAHFQVSEYVVRSALVNRGKASRDLLPLG
jgi:hypothetical protein